MTKITAAALAAALIALAYEIDPEAGNGSAPATDGGTEAPPKARRGRPAGSTATPPAETEKPANVGPVLVDEETYKKRQGIIEPYVKAGQAVDVKKIIANYGTCLRDIPEEKMTAFQRDLEALSL